MSTDSSGQSALTPLERRAASALASIFSLRMLGLFMIYPVFSVYARHLPGATPVTIGLALGIYGLTQALLQIPFGLWSDRIGRRKVITIGLLLFAAGSVLAALSHSIYGIIAGRALQGAGAVGSVILALMADLTRDDQRTKAMAIIGMSIGLSFALAVVAGPVFNSHIGVNGIFWLTAVLALLGLAVLYMAVPQPDQQRLHRDNQAVPALLAEVLKNGQLLRLDFGIFAQHAMLTATFLGLPVLLRDSSGLQVEQEWALYLPVLAASVVLMVPLIIYGERNARLKSVFIGAIVASGLAQLVFALGYHSLWLLVPVIVVFFTAFNLLESSLPSLISRLAPAGMKGTAMGVYSSSQFFGIFVGGVAGGWLQSHFGLPGVFGFSVLLALLWLAVTAGLRNPGHMSSRVVSLGALKDEAPELAASRIRAITGVLDVAVAPEDGTAILKVDSRQFDEPALDNLLGKAPAATPA
ncbi:major facilitator family transporter [Alcanivorax hongdengensis A-11-3]|uniref:Major facilitator family transporter n=1 Tax=Alcanivorax hongdengensis A-11-3 TaxID=1177179 RepID=L0WBT5_9GAMM|nr:MFS transporter [Alcanivorax hongdengensis]EKF74444.1 major facilitator family transporter [Alcanivorax hongdengensis A-11-3]